MKVLLGMSGGIDSCVSAWLLKEQGFEVEGATMLLWKRGTEKEGTEGRNACFKADPSKLKNEVEELSKKLEISAHMIDLSDDFEKIVLKNFKSEYLSGRTPNPCVLCNKRIKFSLLLEKAKEMNLEFDKIATGHYARIEKKNKRYCLRKAVDKKKDQSYFLYQLTQQQLSKTIFPLGEMTKQEVREIDKTLNLHKEDQSESQDFYSGPYVDLLDVKPKEGNIITMESKILGHHDGFWNYTIGQRRGLKIAYPEPLYVLELRVATNEVVVGTKDEVDHKTVFANQINWVSIDKIDNPIKAFAKIRSTGSEKPGILSFDGERLSFEFENKQKAPTTGQSLVVYDEEGYILCGGIINEIK